MAVYIVGCWFRYLYLLGFIIIFPLPTYEIFIFLSTLKPQVNHSFENIGFAYVGGACVVNKRLEKVNSVAIVEDTGGFSGIIVAAHELGHL